MSKDFEPIDFGYIAAEIIEKIKTTKLSVSKIRKRSSFVQL
jgi:hypothetical protein